MTRGAQEAIFAGNACRNALRQGTQRQDRGRGCWHGGQRPVPAMAAVPSVRYR